MNIHKESAAFVRAISALHEPAFARLGPGTRRVLPSSESHSDLDI